MALGFVTYLWAMAPKSPYNVLLSFVPLYIAIQAMVAIPLAGRIPAILPAVISLTAIFWDRRNLGIPFVFIVISAMVGPILYVIHIDQPNDEIFF